MARTVLYLVRHGEQSAASDHAVDGDLSDLGRHQADLLGRRLHSVPFSAIHHSPLPRAAQTAQIVATHMPLVPRHPCELVTDRTPVPSPAQRADYPEHYLPWLDAVPAQERDDDAVQLQATVAHLSATTDQDRRELLITHNYVIGWFVRHVLDAPTWRWIGLNHANGGITVVQWETDRPPALLHYNDVGHLP